MNIEHHKQYLGTPFSVVSKPINNEPGTWASSRVTIYRDYKVIGDFIRNYPSYAAATFAPFSVGNEWYALYSPHYTALRVMKLNKDSIEDWCGDEPSTHGFCPVEVLIPQFMKFEATHGSRFIHNTEFKSHLDFMKEKDSKDFKEHGFHKFGFMSGCVWGDDSSWKLRYIDLSKVEEKELIITEKFGYWELPDNLELKDCINLRYWASGTFYLTKCEEVEV